MTKLELPRRKFLGTFAALLAAPAIVPYRSLMPVKVMDWVPVTTLDAYAEYVKNVLGNSSYVWGDGMNPLPVSTRTEEVKALIDSSYPIVPWSDEELAARLADERQNPYYTKA
jgi:hypothetical protein